MSRQTDLGMSEKRFAAAVELAAVMLQLFDVSVCEVLEVQRKNLQLRDPWFSLQDADALLRSVLIELLPTYGERCDGSRDIIRELQQTLHVPPDTRLSGGRFPCGGGFMKSPRQLIRLTSCL